VIVLLEIVIEAVPLLVNVTDSLAFFPRYTVPKLTVAGAMVRAEMKFATTLSGPLMVTVVDALLGLATVPVQLLNAYPVLAVADMFTTVPDA
jgi:hypothetical protein